jgi:methionyl-tRNA formyltransferase
VRVLLGGNKRRGVACLKAVLDSGHEVVGVLAHPFSGEPAPETFAAAGRSAGLPLVAPVDVNSRESTAALRALGPDVVALAGYGQIVRREFLELAPRGCLNLHGGKLPEYRGSSPLNWALINGEREVTLTVIRVDLGVDTGDIVLERTLQVGLDETIAELNERADAVFPELLLEALEGEEAGTLSARPQDESRAAYYPLRFPDDGLVLFDLLSAEEVHNRIRALTDPYPAAFTFHGGRRIRLLRSRRSESVVFGEPGRVYATRDRAILVCAADRCLWIEQAVDEHGADALAAVARYDRLATMREMALTSLGAGH